MALTIRLLAEADAPVLQQLLSWSPPPVPVSLDRCRAMLAHPGTLAVAALDQGRPVGLAVGYLLERPRGRALYLHEIDVHPDFRRRGLAAGMLEFLKRHGREQGLSRIFLFTNQENIPAMELYRKTGARRPNRDDVLFEYDLTGS